MVIILSDGKKPYEKEITDILLRFGASLFSEHKIAEGNKFSLVSVYNKTEISIESAIVLMLCKSDKFKGQKLPEKALGICEEQNKTAFSLFKNRGVPTVSCGMGNKNTVTVSSLEEKTILVTLQRTIKTPDGKYLYPEEFKINLSKKYSPFSVMAAAVILICEGILPDTF